jgi:hypothetical protein
MATTAWINKQKKREAMVKKYADGAGQAPARFQPDAIAHAVRDHRAVPWRAPQVQGLAHHAAGTGECRANPGTEESKLVS